MHGLSIEAQLAALDKWAEDKTVVGHYVDRGISARSPATKRPELQRLLRDIEKGKVDVVAFTKLDRWFRSVREYYRVQDTLDAHNVAWRAIHEDYETETASGRLKVNVMLAVAQDEADRTSERVKAVFAEKRRKGLALNGHMPPGIVYSGGVLSPGPDAEKIRALFRYYIATRSVNATTRATQDILGKAYSARGTRQLLTNERYIDTGVVTPETWGTAQSILESRATRNARTDRAYLFSGLVLCPGCGHRLTVRTNIIKGVEYIYYRCDDALRCGRCSWKGSVREDRLEEYLVKHILSTYAKHTVKVAQKQKKSVNPSSIQKKLDKLTDLYLNDEIEKEDFDRRAAPLRDQLKTAKSATKPVNTAEIASVLDVYSSLTKPAQKAFWSALVKSITPTDSGFDIAFI